LPGLSGAGFPASSVGAGHSGLARPDGQAYGLSLVL